MDNEPMTTEEVMQLQQAMLASWKEDQQALVERQEAYLRAANPIQSQQRDDGTIIWVYHEDLALAKTLLESQDPASQNHHSQLVD